MSNDDIERDHRMSFMDSALDNYKAPSAEDMEIELPARREPKDGGAAGQQPGTGQHGGASGAPGASDAQNAAVADAAGTGGGGAEPVPQRDEPDEGEHTDSTEEEVEARARRAAAAEQAHRTVDADAADLEELRRLESMRDFDTDADTDLEPERRAQAQRPTDVRRELAGIAGSTTRTFEKTGFKSGDVETVLVKRFPQPLVDRLRLSLAPAVGGEFAEAMSAPALITAFLMAKTGVELDVDANTAVAVDVFRQVDPRLLAVENKMDAVADDVARIADAIRLSSGRIKDTGAVVDGMEFSLAYLVADRVAGLTTTDVDETNVDVTQKKVLAARENIRTRAKKQRSIEKQREGRRMS